MCRKRPRASPPRLYTAEDANLVRAVSEQAVPALRVAQILGLRVRDLYALETAGILRTVFYDVTSGKRAKRYHLPDAHLIADRFGRDVEPTVPSVSFKTFAETMRITHGELARAVATGEFVPVGRRGRGCCFSGMRFAGVSDQGSVAPGMSAREASQRLEVQSDLLKWLCSTGHLSTTGDNLRNGGISVSDVQRLEKLYVSTAVLASRMEVGNGAKAARVLASHGIGMLRATSHGSGLALRADIEALDPNLLASSETDRAWAVLRESAGANCGPWRFPSSAKGDHVQISMTANKVSLVLKFGESMTMTVDCSPKTSIRRWRILEPRLAELPDLLPDFRLVRKIDGESFLSSSVALTPQRMIDANAVHWFRSNLFALAAVFGARSAGRPPEPERERRVAEMAEQRREWAKTLSATHPRKRVSNKRAVQAEVDATALMVGKRR